MASPDLNLLHMLDMLLRQERAARRLLLSPSAMCWALARLRTLTGDELLVRAGDNLVPTPRAVEMREKVRELVQKAHVLLRPSDRLNLSMLERGFTLRTSDGFPERFGAPLIRKVQEEAPAFGCASSVSSTSTTKASAMDRSTSRPELSAARRAPKCARRPYRRPLCRGGTRRSPAGPQSDGWPINNLLAVPCA